MFTGESRSRPIAYGRLVINHISRAVPRRNAIVLSRSARFLKNASRPIYNRSPISKQSNRRVRKRHGLYPSDLHWWRSIASITRVNQDLRVSITMTVVMPCLTLVLYGRQDWTLVPFGDLHTRYTPETVDFQPAYGWNWKLDGDRFPIPEVHDWASIGL